MSNDTKPATGARAVTPTDNTAIPVTRALYVGGAGNIVVKMADVVDPTAAGNTVTFTGVLAGSVLPISVKCVNSTSTTATSIVALY
jgi:hypothetical protein